MLARTVVEVLAATHVAFAQARLAVAVFQTLLCVVTRVTGSTTVNVRFVAIFLAVLTWGYALALSVGTESPGAIAVFEASLAVCALVTNSSATVNVGFCTISDTVLAAIIHTGA